jgi:two-component sensor histidine kinase
MQRSIKLTTKPIWQDIEKIRIRSNDFLTSHGLSIDTVSAVTMIISELVENSIKYGCFQNSKNKVEVNISIADDDITVEVINPFDDTVHAHLKRLDKTIQWIRGYQDPFEAYVERMKEVSRKPIADEESGLGLVRIAYEGGAILDFYLNDMGMLNVSTISKFK